MDFLRSVMPPTTEPAFFRFLLQLDCSKVTVRSVPEGSVVFARVSFSLSLSLSRTHTHTHTHTNGLRGGRGVCGGTHLWCVSTRRCL